MLKSQTARSLSLSRRVFMLVPAALTLGAAAGGENDARAALQALERRSGGRIGLTVTDTADGRTLRYREDERFLMCSSFKLSLAAAVLKRAEGEPGLLARVIHYTNDDLLPVSPATTKNLAAGMKVEDLCEAAVIYSDNAAANLLLAEIGGPPAVTQFWRSVGDTVSRLDRKEPALNVPDGDKDTTTPAAMLNTLQHMLLGTALSETSQRMLRGWMRRNTTGDAMLRAGLPKSWIVGDKTGRYTSEKGNAIADLAIATPPGRKPIVIASFAMNGDGDDAAHQAVIAEVGAIVAAAFA
jgi:beta-lactamase class A